MGRCFLRQLRFYVQNTANIQIHLIASSKKSFFPPNPWESKTVLDNWELELNSEGDDDPLDIARSWVPQNLKSAYKCQTIFIDLTSSEDVASLYPVFLIQGISVVTANKKAFSGSSISWKRLRHFQAPIDTSTRPGLLYHESSVGAGLPVISTLNDLIRTGDEVCSIEGVFSGTMSFLFDSFAPTEGQGGKWSEEVRKAKELGYTEPDPRDDLNGVDVARKAVILARLAGLEVHDTNSFPVQSLIPKALEGCGSSDEFMARLPEFDGEMEKVKGSAEAEGKVVRFVGSVDMKKRSLQVGLVNFDKSHPIASLKGSDNIFVFRTKRYEKSPLVIQGAG